MGQKLQQRIDIWKKQLLDFGKRNRLLNYKEGKRSDVLFTSPSYDSIYEKVAVQEKTIVFPFTKHQSVDDDLEEVYESIIEGDVDTSKNVSELQKTLKVLRQRANTSVEEQGVNTLYLTFGMLKWKEADNSSFLLSSPIVMVPVKLIIESLTSPYKLAPYDDDIVVNPTLQHKLENDFGIKFPELEYNQDNIISYLDSCEQTIKNKGWIIERSVHLANLSFLKINMYKDLERNEDKLESNPIVSAIVGESSPIVVEDKYNNYDHDNNERPIDVFQVVDADSSQQDAILLSKQGVSFVLQGPPGTGKSQTITNIISEALADGKKILFVSEKMAALQVVYNRLAAAGLADFCFTLHSHKANKRQILHDLAESINIDRTRVRQEALYQLDLLEHKREELNDYEKQLHTICSGLKTTIFQVNGELSKLEEVPDIIFPINNVESINRQELNSNIYLLEQLSKTLGKKTEDYNNNIWKNSTIDHLTNELRHDIDSNTDSLISYLRKLLTFADNWCSKTGLKYNTIEKIKQLLDFLSLASMSPGIPTIWLDKDIQNLISSEEKYERATTEIREKTGIIEGIYNCNLSNIDAAKVHASLRSHLDKLASCFKNINDDEFAEKVNEYVERFGNIINKATLLFDKAHALESELGVATCTSFKSLDIFANLVKVLIPLENIQPPLSWFNNKQLEEAETEIPNIISFQKEYKEKEDIILQLFDKEILEIDSYSILKRFRGEYDSIFKIFYSSYRSDMSKLRSYLKAENKLDYNKAIESLSAIKELKDLKEKIDSYSTKYVGLYGGYYHGTETNCDELKDAITKFKMLHSFSPISSKLKSLLYDGNLPIDALRHFNQLSNSNPTSEIIDSLSDLLDMNFDKDTRFTFLIDTYDSINQQAQDFIQTYNTAKSWRINQASFSKLLSELDIIDDIQRNNNFLIKEDGRIKEIFGSYYQGTNTNWERVRNALDYAEALSSYKYLPKISRTVIKKICNNQEFVNICSDDYEQLNNLISLYDKPFNWFTSLFYKENFEQYDLEALITFLYDCRNKKDLLEEWLDYKTIRKKCADNGMSPYLEQLEKNPIDDNYTVKAYLKRFYRLWLDKMLPSFPAVQSFRSSNFEQTINEFRNLDLTQFKIAQARVRERITSRMPDFDSITSSMDEIGILKREVNKQRKIMPLRKLFASIPNLLPALRPCFMMSPLSVSVFLEAKSYEFDLVIFDEASQVHTEDAIGAIMRGKQVIIVGDTKQLPPTNFFTSALNDEDFDIDKESDDDSGAFDSILDESVVVLPERSLLWHYRSRDEKLIAFSNIKIYNKSLITFPSVIEHSEDLGVEYIYVKNGVYDRSIKRNNPVEAYKVAQLVIDHFRKHPNRSLGVVTFSEAQQNAVEAAIRKLRLENSSFETFFNEDREEPFFIKNLENVQGDERDTIIFSIGYAKDSKGIMYMNFGPLSRDGGYRRLNVAITRAKYNVKLVGSIEPTDIDLTRTSSEGVKLLRSYIEYAQQGIAALESEITVPENLLFDSPFEESVYDFLSKKGYNVVTQVGCSGFRIDMAVKHPHKPGKFAIGIECDGAMYHSSRTARERDRLRQTILEDMGWDIYRIWSTDWIKNPKSEEEKLVNAIEKAISMSDIDFPVVTPSLNQERITIDIEEKIESPIEDKDKSLGFVPYEKADIYSAGFYDISSVVRNVIEIEQPIHFEELCRRVAPLYGNKKASSFVRSNVNFIISYSLRHIIESHNDFLSLKNNKEIKVRVPKSDDDVRSIEYISEEELSLAMKTLAKKSFGISPEALITETARIFGFKRTGEKISIVLKLIYAQLILKGELKETEGKVQMI